MAKQNMSLEELIKGQSVSLGNKGYKDPGKEIIEALDGNTYSSYAEFETAILNEFNLRIARFPNGYTYTDFMRWAYRRGWIKITGERYEIRYTILN